MSIDRDYVPMRIRRRLSPRVTGLLQACFFIASLSIEGAIPHSQKPVPMTQALISGDPE